VTTSSASLPEKEIDVLRKNAGRSGQKALAARYATPPAPSTAEGPEPAISKSRLKVIRKYSGRANAPAVALWDKERTKKSGQKRVAAKR
jgi:hypothetical protein